MCVKKDFYVYRLSFTNPGSKVLFHVVSTDIDTLYIHTHAVEKYVGIIYIFIFKMK